MENAWDREALQSRIADSEKRQRHEAGSPDPSETACYRACLDRFAGPEPFLKAAVLGMTPELRGMLLEYGAELSSVDNNPESIRVYRDWVTPPPGTAERIIQADWFEIDRVLAENQDVVLGDGVFGNILSLEGHRRLLALFRARLKPGGGLILRQCLVPAGFDPEKLHYENLLESYRAGRLSPAEFGFSMRIFGLFAEAYHPDTFRLDNRTVFETYEKLYRSGELTADEYAAIRNYLFLGENLILPQEVWEELVASAGFDFDRHILTGKQWYEYYFIYSCKKA